MLLATTAESSQRTLFSGPASASGQNPRSRPMQVISALALTADLKSVAASFV